MFKKLTAEEEVEYRAWARESYKPGSEISMAWHPVVQEECVRMNREAFVPAA
jgi:hypothetical protein